MQKSWERRLVCRYTNPSDAPDEEWDPPRLSAVQISAAITACARIHMYKYISRDDCYYTDTDSAVLGSPLPEDEVSSTILGKMKLEAKIKKGIFLFLASKSYSYIDFSGKTVNKHKGPAHDMADHKWFELQYQQAGMDKLQAGMDTILRSDDFNRSWRRLEILRKTQRINKNILLSDRKKTSRIQKRCLATPRHVLDCGKSIRLIGRVIQLVEKMKENEMRQILADKDREIQLILEEKNREIQLIRQEKDRELTQVPIRVAKTRNSLDQEPLSPPDSSISSWKRAALELKKEREEYLSREKIRSSLKEMIEDIRVTDKKFIEENFQRKR